jgi:hypothetical protein
MDGNDTQKMITIGLLKKVSGTIFDGGILRSPPAPLKKI